MGMDPNATLDHKQIAAGTPPSLIQWNERCTVYDRLLDDQHQELLGIINSLYNAQKNRAERIPVRDLIYQLRSCAKRHFSDEICVLRAVGCPNVEEHLREHEKMLAVLRILTIQFERGQDILFDLLTELKDWWQSHEVGWDRELSTYILAAFPMIPKVPDPSP